MFLCICPHVFVYLSKCVSVCVIVYFCAFDSLWVLPQACFFSGKNAVPGFGDMSKLQNMRVLRILSIFLAVGIAAGVFFSGKKAVPGFWGHATLEKTQFFSCFVYLGPFGSPLESLWLPLGWPWLPLGCHWAPFGVPLARFGCPWLPLGALGLPLGAQCSPFAMPVHKIKPRGTRRRSRWSRRSHRSRGSGVKNSARSPPPTRAGGQDDGSYTNSLKLHKCAPAQIYPSRYDIKQNASSWTSRKMYL